MLIRTTETQSYSKHRRKYFIKTLFLLAIIYQTVATIETDEYDLLAEILAEEVEADDEYHKNNNEEYYADDEPIQQERQKSQSTHEKKGGMPKGANMDFSSIEEEIRRREAAAAASRAAEEERLAAEEAEKRRLAREAKFEADLAKMDKEKAKAARRQKKLDARIVRRILRASKKEKHYVVLGLRNWEVTIGPWHLFRVTTRDVKKAYRTLAKQVHPDKNRDGRAEEAFDALERSAAVLSDEKLKSDYDQKLRRTRRERRKEIVQTTADYLEVGRRTSSKVISVFYKVVGPFSTPILIMGFLII